MVQTFKDRSGHTYNVHIGLRILKYTVRAEFENWLEEVECVSKGTSFIRVGINFKVIPVWHLGSTEVNLGSL